MFLGLERKVVFRIRRKDHGSITWTELNVAGHKSCLISLEQCWCWSRDELVTWDVSSSSTPHQSGHRPGHVVWAELRGWRLLHCWLMIGRVEVTVDLYTETEWFQIFLTQSSSSRCFPHQLSFCWSENGFLQNQSKYIFLDLELTEPVMMVLSRQWLVFMRAPLLSGWECVPGNWGKEISALLRRLSWTNI